MWLTERRLDILSRYFSDTSKIIFASTVIGFFIPTGGPIPFPVFIGGFIAAIGFLIFSLALSK